MSDIYKDREDHAVLISASLLLAVAALNNQFGDVVQAVTIAKSILTEIHKQDEAAQEVECTPTTIKS